MLFLYVAVRALLGAFVRSRRGRRECDEGVKGVKTQFSAESGFRRPSRGGTFSGRGSILSYSRQVLRPPSASAAVRCRRRQEPGLIPQMASDRLRVQTCAALVGEMAERRPARAPARLQVMPLAMRAAPVPVHAPLSPPPDAPSTRRPAPVRGAHAPGGGERHPGAIGGLASSQEDPPGCGVPNRAAGCACGVLNIRSLAGSVGCRP